MEGVRYGKGVLQHSRGDIRKKLEAACYFLPVEYAIECRNRVSSNSNYVIDKLIEHLRPEKICAPGVLGFCDKTYGIPNIKHQDWLIAKDRHGDVDVN